MVKKGTGYFLERILIMSKIVRGLVDDKGEYARALVWSISLDLVSPLEKENKRKK